MSIAGTDSFPYVLDSLTNKSSGLIRAWIRQHEEILALERSGVRLDRALWFLLWAGGIVWLVAAFVLSGLRGLGGGTPASPLTRAAQPANVRLVMWNYVAAGIRAFGRRPGTTARRTMRILLSREERLARLTGPLGYWFQLRTYQLNLLVEMGLAPPSTLLDFGCGPLQGGIAFISHLAPNSYVGIDIREEPLIEGYRLIAKYRLTSKNPQLLCSTSFGLQELSGRQFDFAWASQVMYHFDAPTLDRFFEAVAKLLAPGGRLYGDIILPGPQDTAHRALTPALSHPTGEGARRVAEGNHDVCPGDCSVGPAVGSGWKWRGFKVTRHPSEFVAEVASRHGLLMRRIGRIAEFGYPIPGVLKDNVLLEFSAAERGSERQTMNVRNSVPG